MYENGSMCNITFYNQQYWRYADSISVTITRKYNKNVFKMIILLTSIVKDGKYPVSGNIKNKNIVL